MTKLNISILGSDGTVGAAVTNELLERGHLITGINLSGQDKFGRQLKTIKADILDYNKLVEASLDSDLVISAFQPNSISVNTWKTDYPIFIKNLIDLGKSGKRIIFIDNMEAYGDVNGSAIKEGAIFKPASIRGQIRGFVSSSFEKAVKENEIQASIVKSSVLFGPYAIKSIFGDRFFHQLFSEKTNPEIQPSFNLPFSFTYSRDLAEVVENIAEKPSVDGHIFNVPTMQPMAILEMANLIIEESKCSKKVVSMPNWLFKIKLLIDPNLQRAKDFQYLNKYPYLVDSTKYIKFFPNYTASSTEEAVKETISWFKRRLA